MLRTSAIFVGLLGVASAQVTVTQVVCGVTVGAMQPSPTSEPDAAASPYCGNVVQDSSAGVYYVNCTNAPAGTSLATYTLANPMKARYANSSAENYLLDECLDYCDEYDGNGAPCVGATLDVANNLCSLLGGSYDEYPLVYNPNIFGADCIKPAPSPTTGAAPSGSTGNSGAMSTVSVIPVSSGGPTCEEVYFDALGAEYFVDCNAYFGGNDLATQPSSPISLPNCFIACDNAGPSCARVLYNDSSATCTLQGSVFNEGSIIVDENAIAGYLVLGVGQAPASASPTATTTTAASVTSAVPTATGSPVCGDDFQTNSTVFNVNCNSVVPGSVIASYNLAPSSGARRVKRQDDSTAYAFAECMAICANYTGTPDCTRVLFDSASYECYLQSGSNEDGAAQPAGSFQQAVIVATGVAVTTTATTTVGSSTLVTTETSTSFSSVTTTSESISTETPSTTDTEISSTSSSTDLGASSSSSLSASVSLPMSVTETSISAPTNATSSLLSVTSTPTVPVPVTTSSTTLPVSVTTTPTLPAASTTKTTTTTSSTSAAASCSTNNIVANSNSNYNGGKAVAITYSSLCNSAYSGYALQPMSSSTSPQDCVNQCEAYNTVNGDGRCVAVTYVPPTGTATTGTCSLQYGVGATSLSTVTGSQALRAVRGTCVGGNNVFGDLVADGTQSNATYNSGTLTLLCSTNYLGGDDYPTCSGTGSTVEACLSTCAYTDTCVGVVMNGAGQCCLKSVWSQGGTSGASTATSGNPSNQVDSAFYYTTVAPITTLTTPGTCSNTVFTVTANTQVAAVGGGAQALSTYTPTCGSVYRFSNSARFPVTGVTTVQNCALACEAHINQYGVGRCVGATYYAANQTCYLQWGINPSNAQDTAIDGSTAATAAGAVAIRKTGIANCIDGSVFGTIYMGSGGVPYAALCDENINAPPGGDAASCMGSATVNTLNTCNNLCANTAYCQFGVFTNGQNGQFACCLKDLNNSPYETAQYSATGANQVDSGMVHGPSYF